MTKNKRFTIEKKGGMFYIFDNGNLIPVSDGQPICDLLNELAEENKGFKIDGEFKNKAYSKLLDSFMGLKKKYQGIKKENKELKKENEQLKQRNDFLREQLDRVCIDNETMGDKLKQIGRIL